jgi:hypothetical protein
LGRREGGGDAGRGIYIGRDVDCGGAFFNIFINRHVGVRSSHDMF